MDIKILNINMNSFYLDDKIIARGLKDKYNLTIISNINKIYSESERLPGYINSLVVYTFDIDSQIYILKVYSQTNKNIYLSRKNKIKDNLFIQLVKIYKEFNSIETFDYYFENYSEKNILKNKEFSGLNIIKNIRNGYNISKTSASNNINITNLLVVKVGNQNKLYQFNFEIAIKA